jgi:hypothetical protein
MYIVDVKCAAICEAGRQAGSRVYVLTDYDDHVQTLRWRLSHFTKKKQYVE